MIIYFTFFLLSFSEIKTEGLELHCSLWEQKEEYLTGEPIFLRISVVNTSKEEIGVLPIEIPLGITGIYIELDGKREILLNLGTTFTWSFSPKSPCGGFYRLTSGDSLYRYIFINEHWEWKVPSTTHHYEIVRVRHGLNLKFFPALKNCSLSPLGGKIEKEFNIGFTITPPEDIRELELITTIRNPKYPFAPKKSWGEKMEAYRELKEKYPDSPYLPIAMNLLEKKKFLKTHPNNPLVYSEIREVAKISIGGIKKIPPEIKEKVDYKRAYRESFENFDREKCLEYFNSFLNNEKYRGTLLEDAILLWIDDVEQGKVNAGRTPSSIYRRKLK